MNSSIFNGTEHDDPWANAWEDLTVPARELSPLDAFGASSLYHQQPQPEPINSNYDNEFDTFKVPSSFHRVYEANPNIDLTPKLKQLLERVVEGGLLTQYQVSKLLDQCYDHSLLPASVPENLWQILGLLTLELDSPGSGDYVSLKFSKGTLPELSKDAVALLCGRDPAVVMKSSSPSKQRMSGPSSVVGDFLDPLNVSMGNTSLTEAEDLRNVVVPSSSGLLGDDTILAEHPAISSTLNQMATTYLSNPAPDRDIIKYINDIRDEFKPLLELKAVVRIKEVPEKEGLLFKHINYNISHELNLGLLGPAGPKKVVRRYSDFVWLLEYLLKKYPFRIIPGLPPKKFNGSSPDSQFLQKRRRGLHRFLNQLVRHPVLVQESVVVTFLSVPTDLATWRKQAKIDNLIEFKGQKILTDFIEKIWPAINEEFLKDWQTAEIDIAKLIEYWTKIVLLVERHEKRQQQISFDNQKFSEMLNRFNSCNQSIYPTEGPNSQSSSRSIIASTNVNDVSALNESIAALSEHFVNLRQLLLDDSFAINSGLLEKFKNYLDYLYLLQELFERLKSLSVNNVPELQKRIADSEQHFAKLSNEDVDIKGSDLARLRQSIVNDKQELFQQLNRAWLIKECCFKEFLMFQETQYLVSDMWVDWAKGRNGFQQKMGGFQESIYERISRDMPTK